MNCFSCFSSHEKRASKRFDAERGGSPSPRAPTRAPPKSGSELCKSPAGNHIQNATSIPEETTPKEPNNSNITAPTFTFRELASATMNFRPDNLLGEGCFGRVYKGFLEKSGQHVAIKQLDKSGVHGNKEFLVEVLMLSLLHHQNLVNLIGYCADGAQRLLVYEYMPLGSLVNHLLEISPDQSPLSWYIRMKVAFDAAKGLEYLHEKASRPIVFRDFKSSNILLAENYEAKLSDFGLAKLGAADDKLHASLIGTYGYCAPEYSRTGQFTMKSDIYSFGVVLLELITGRRAIDTSKPTEEQNLVTWAKPKFKDQRRYHELVDPLLQGDYPERGLNQAVAVAAMCLQEEAEVRPFMTDVSVALSHLIGAPSSVGSSGHDNQSQSSQEEGEDADSDNQQEQRDVGRQPAAADAIECGSKIKANHEACSLKIESFSSVE